MFYVTLTDQFSWRSRKVYDRRWPSNPSDFDITQQRSHSCHILFLHSEKLRSFLNNLIFTLFRSYFFFLLYLYTGGGESFQEKQRHFQEELRRNNPELGGGYGRPTTVVNVRRYNLLESVRWDKNIIIEQLEIIILYTHAGNECNQRV